MSSSSGEKLVFINGKYVATMALPEWREPLYQMSAKMTQSRPFQSDTWREYLEKRLGEDKVECAKCGRWVAPRHLDASAHCQECAEQVPDAT